MKRNKLSIIVVSICLVFILAAIPFTSGCGGAGPSEKEPIKIGALLPLVGQHAMWGPWYERAHRYALDEVNWEVAGRPIELIVENDGDYDPSAMMEILKKVVEVDKADVLFGPFCNPSRVPAFSYLEPRKIVSVHMTGESQDGIKYDYHFEMEQGFVDVNYCMGQYAAEELGLKTVATIAWDLEASRDFVGGFCDAFTKYGGTVVQQQWTELGAADYTPYLLALQEADGVAVMCAGAESQMRILTQAYELGIPQKMEWFVCGTAELESPEIRDQLGDKGVGAYYSGPWLASIDTPENKEFIAGYEDKLGVTPTCWDTLKYCETRVMLAGLEATGGDPDGDKLKQALLELQIDLPIGPFSFDEGRIGVLNFYVGQVQKVGGEYIGAIVKTYPKQHTSLTIYPH